MRWENIAATKTAESQTTERRQSTIGSRLYRTIVGMMSWKLLAQQRLYTATKKEVDAHYRVLLGQGLISKEEGESSVEANGKRSG